MSSNGARQNIFKIISYPDLEHIFDDNNNKLIVIMFSGKKCDHCVTMRPVFLNASKKYTDTVFIYIDKGEFKDTVNFLAPITTIPRFSFYFNKHELAVVEGANPSMFINVIEDILYKLANPPPIIAPTVATTPVAPVGAAVVHSPPQLSNDDLHHDKLIMLKKLYDLTKLGKKLSSTYTIDSDINDMIWEYEIHTNLSNIKVGDNSLDTRTDQDYENIIKQKKIEQIKNLSNLSNLNKQKQLNCIEQLLEIKKQRNRK